MSHDEGISGMVTSWMRQFCAVVVGLMLATVPAALSQLRSSSLRYPRSSNSRRNLRRSSFSARNSCSSLLRPLRSIPIRFWRKS